MTRDEATRTMIVDPGMWVHFPFLPMRKGNLTDIDNMELGVIHSVGTALKTDLKPIVIKSNMLMLPRSLGELKQLDSIDFDSVDEMMEAGWRVD